MTGAAASATQSIRRRQCGEGDVKRCHGESAMPSASQAAHARSAGMMQPHSQQDLYTHTRDRLNILTQSLHANTQTLSSSLSHTYRHTQREKQKQKHTPTQRFPSCLAAARQRSRMQTTPPRRGMRADHRPLPPADVTRVSAREARTGAHRGRVAGGVAEQGDAAGATSSSQSKANL